MTWSILFLYADTQQLAEIEQSFAVPHVEWLTALSREEALTILAEQIVHVAFLQLDADAASQEFLERLTKSAPTTRIVVALPQTGAPASIATLRSGASDLLFLPSNASEISAALQRAIQHYQQLDATALHRASQAIFSARDPAELLEVIVEAALNVMRADAVSLLLPGVDGALYVAHAIGLPPEAKQQTRICLGEQIAGRIALAGKPRVICGDARTAGFSHAVARDRVKSSIVYPLVTNGRLLGMLTFNRLELDRNYSAADLEKASILAAHVMLALENRRLAEQAFTAEKLAAVGQLSAGIAHEINTPIQFIGDSIGFLEQAFQDLGRLRAAYIALRARAQADGNYAELLTELEEIEEDIDVQFVYEQIPKAIARTSDGVNRVVEIVRAIKEFGHPDAKEKVPTDLNKSIAMTLAVAKSEYKYVADIVTDLAEIPDVLCHPGEINQVLLNLLVNASHAIADATRNSATRGTITVRSRVEREFVAVSIEDTGTGIPEAARARIFEPFFTTKAVGRGTGLGLPIARTIVVEKHGGELTFETELGRGTRFLLRLPLLAEAAA